MCWPWMIEGMRDVVEVVMSLGVLEARVMIAKARTENIMKRSEERRVGKECPV